MTKILTFRNEIIKKIIILLTVVTILTLLLKEYSIMKGFLAGGITSLLLFIIRMKQITKKMLNDDYNFVRQSILSFLFRYFFMFVILALAFLKQEISFVATIIGIFSLQIIIMWNEVIEEKLGFKKRIRYCE
jgi:hypothetical protein